MTRLKLLAFALAATCGCTQLKVPEIPLTGETIDPSLSQFDAHFKGPAAARNNIATQTSYSTQLQKKGLGVAPDEQINAYLNGVLGRLQETLPGTPAAARIHATPNTEFNATSYQDGGIYIPYKVLETLESEDELAALIGHEYAHILLQHHKTNWIDSVASLAYSAGTYYIASQGKTATQENLLGMLMANNAALGVSQIGLVPALTREQEEQADKLGSDLLVRAGYSLVGALNLMSRMESWEQRNRAILEQRKSNYIDLFSKQETSIVARVIDGQLDALETKIGQLMRKTAQHHQASEQRSQMLREYLKQHHADAERPELSEASLAAALKSDHAKQFFAGLDHAHRSTELLQQRDFKQAMTQATNLEQGPASRVPFARHALMNAMAMTNRKDDALAILEGDVGSGDALFVDNMLLLNVLKPSHPEQALALAQRSYDRYDDSPELLPELIQLNKQLKNEFAVMKFYGVCAGKALSAANNALLESCNKAKS